MMWIVPVVLSIGAIYALIPVIVIVILIAAAAGIKSGSMDGIFGLFGFAAIASFVGNKGAIGGGKSAGKGFGGTKYKSDTKALKEAAMKMGENARKARLAKQFGKGGYISAKADSILAQAQKQPVGRATVDTLAADWGKGKMAVSQEVINRYRRGMRGPQLIAKKPPIGARLFSKVASTKDVGINTLYRHGITSGAAAAIENRMYPDMRDHNQALNDARDKVYTEANRKLSQSFKGTSYNAASTFDNWSERVIGTRLIGGILPSQPGTGTPTPVSLGPAIIGIGDPAVATTGLAYRDIWTRNVKGFVKPFTKWSYTNV